MRTGRMRRLGLAVLTLSVLAAPAALANSPKRESVQGERVGAVPAMRHLALASGGPLTKIDISERLACDVVYQNEPSGVFEGSPTCGTWVYVGPTDEGVLYGPFNTAAGDFQEYTPVNQTTWTGSGTTADPYTLTTVVALGSTGIRLTQIDQYVLGLETYRTTVRITRSAGSSAQVRLYRMGDCNHVPPGGQRGLANSPAGAIACRHPAASPTPDRTTQWTPITSKSHYLLEFWTQVSSWVGFGQDFDDTCDCATEQDNSAGIQWRATMGPNSSRTFHSLFTVSASGAAPTFPAPLPKEPSRQTTSTAPGATRPAQSSEAGEPCGALTDQPAC